MSTTETMFIILSLAGTALLSALIVLIKEDHLSRATGRVLFYGVVSFWPIVRAGTHFSCIFCGVAGCGFTQKQLMVSLMSPLGVSLMVRNPSAWSIYMHPPHLLLTCGSYMLQTHWDADEMKVVGSMVAIYVFGVALSSWLGSMERCLWRSQYQAAATFLGSVSHELRTPIHVVRI
jgi:signal transduction histidine kinase